jgi:4-amino-4-deoxy-L-arabinose transferase-like glycosyltransferase
MCGSRRRRRDPERVVTPRVRSAWVAAALVLLCAALYAAPAARTPFYTKGEPREGLVVRQMLDGGDWILPKRPAAAGWTIASKPPLFHWLGALASSAAGGATEWTVRLPSVALGSAGVLLVWAVGRTVLPSGAALAGALVLATSLEWLRAASTARVDATLAALMTVGLLIFYRGVVREGLSRAEALVAYLALAGAALTKGPVGTVLPLLVLAAALAAHGRLRLLPRFRPLLGGLVIVAVVGGWYAAAAWLGGEAFVAKQILKENVFRFLGTSRMRSGHAHPFYYYLPTLAAGLLPWTPFLAGPLVAAARSAPVRRDPRIGFLLVWLVVVLLFYSLASAKRSVYLLPLYPAAALLIGWWWDRLARGADVPRAMRGRGARTAAALLCAAAALPLAVALAEIAGLAPFRLIEPLLHPTDRANLPIVRAILAGHAAAVLAALGVILGSALAFRLVLRRERWAALFATWLAFAITLWVLAFGVLQPDLGRRRTLEPFLAEAARLAGDEPLYFYPPTFDFGAAFYAPARARYLADGDPRARYVLIWDVDLAALPPAERARLEPLAASEGTDPRGRRHMLLARRR